MVNDVQKSAFGGEPKPRTLQIILLPLKDQTFSSQLDHSQDLLLI